MLTGQDSKYFPHSPDIRILRHATSLNLDPLLAQSVGQQRVLTWRNGISLMSGFLRFRAVFSRAKGHSRQDSQRGGRATRGFASNVVCPRVKETRSFVDPGFRI